MEGTVKKILKGTGIVLLTIMAVLLLFIIISYINHRIQLSKEDKLFVPIGRQVKVNDNIMNVYSEGDGDTTLVFMSGGGTSSPVLDFKSLYSLLSDKFRIVVVEKVGYGYSEVKDIERDIDSILSDTRQALELANIQGPFVLCPHSMSGIEALYWAQTYPEEISAIIGLDMSVPEAYTDYNINLPMIQLGKFAADMGITRWVKGLAESDAIKYGTLNKQEKEWYKVIFYRRTATITMINEVKQVKSNAARVGEKGMLHTPILIFSSDGQGTGWNPEEWRGFQKDFLTKCENGSLIPLDCSHYVHDIEYKRISEEIILYLNNIQ